MLSLKLIQKDITPSEIKLLAKWRKKVQPIWHETFRITYRETRKWIIKIIDNPKKMLFFIVKNNELIGHVGYDEIGEGYCYIGNVIRGEGRSDGSMTQAVRTLIKIASGKSIYLKVLPDNKDAIKFYKKLGFKLFSKGIYLVMKI
jgi:RimJ/RimL family protein N-acetyltransferase